MGLFNRNKKKPEIREDTTPDAQVVSNPLLRSLLGEDGVDRDTVMNIPAKQRNVYWKRLQNILEHRMCGADIPQVDSIVPDLSATVWFIPG